MLEYLGLGSGFALAAAVQPGPLQAFLFASVTRRGWRRTLPAAFAPLLSDGPIAAVALLLLQRLPPVFGRVLQVSGGLLLLYFAWSSWRTWRRRPVIEATESDRQPRTLLQAALVNLLNPNPYLGWSLILGPAVLRAWREDPALGVGLVVAFYGTMVVALASLILLFGTTGALGPRGRRALVLASALILAGLGAYQLALGLTGFAS